MCENIIKTVKLGNEELEISYDESDLNPRTDNDNATHIVCWHQRYDLGDKHKFDTPQEFLEYWHKLPYSLIKLSNTYKLKLRGLKFDLRLYDHSGLSISVNNTYPYNDEWDSMQVGFVYMTNEDMRKTYGVKHITKKIREQSKSLMFMEIHEYDQYLRGEVYSYVHSKITTCDLGEEHKETIDSCCGYIGYDNLKDAIKYELGEEWSKEL